MAKQELVKQGSPWRQLSVQERELLETMTSQNFPGSKELYNQIEFTQSRQGCGCGCGTIDLACDKEKVRLLL